MERAISCEVNLDTACVELKFADGSMISIDTVAEVVNLSTSYLSFIFKENSGLNFVDYVNQFRLQKAKELLETSSYNISQIARLVGYSSANSFSKVFKKYNGISPGQYRKL